MASAGLSHTTVFLLIFGLARAVAAEPGEIIRAALAAEARLDTRRALELFLTAEKAQPAEAFILQKIARQYSDLTVDLKDEKEIRASAERALAYALRAVALAPANAECVLSLAVCHGKLATYGSTREKVEHSRLIRDFALRALELDPNYAWAHHVLGRWHHEVGELGATARVVVKWFYGGLPAASSAESVRHLQRATELEPAQLQHHLELGFALLADHQPAAARASFERGLAMPSREKHDEAAKARARLALARLSAK